MIPEVTTAHPDEASSLIAERVRMRGVYSVFLTDGAVSIPELLAKRSVWTGYMGRLYDPGVLWFRSGANVQPAVGCVRRRLEKGGGDDRRKSNLVAR